MSYELKTNTAVRIPVGPLVDPTDGKTAEPALDVTALSVQIYQMKTDGSAVVRTQFAPTASGGDNDMALVTSSTDAMYDLELTAAQINWLGNGRISFYDVDGFLVHYFDIHVVSANYFDNKYGATVEQVNVVQWLTQACHAVAENGVPKVDLDQIAGVAVATGTAQLGVNVVSEDNIDFGATKKTSITTAVPTAAAIKTAIEIGGSSLAQILEDTGELQTDNIPGTLATIAGYLDTEIAAIKTQTDLVTAARMGALTDWIDGGRLDLLLDAIKVITDALTAAAATKLALSAGTIGVGTVSWDNTNATTTVFYSDDITEATADHLIGRIVLFTSGALAGPPPQATDITDYALVAGEGKFTVTALTEAPANNVTFIIV